LEYILVESAHLKYNIYEYIEMKCFSCNVNKSYKKMYIHI